MKKKILLFAGVIIFLSGAFPPCAQGSGIGTKECRVKRIRKLEKADR